MVRAQGSDRSPDAAIAAVVPANAGTITTDVHGQRVVAAQKTRHPRAGGDPVSTAVRVDHNQSRVPGRPVKPGDDVLCERSAISHGSSHHAQAWPRIP